MLTSRTASIYSRPSYPSPIKAKPTSTSPPYEPVEAAAGVPVIETGEDEVEVMVAEAEEAAVAVTEPEEEEDEAEGQKWPTDTTQMKNSRP